LEVVLIALGEADEESAMSSKSSEIAPSSEEVAIDATRDASETNTAMKPARGTLRRGCRADSFLKFVAQEWVSHLIWVLGRQGPIRFGELRRSLPGAISARVLSNRLKTLEAHSLVSREETVGKLLKVEYRLTSTGRDLDAALRENEAMSLRFGFRQSAV